MNEVEPIEQVFAKQPRGNAARPLPSSLNLPVPTSEVPIPGTPVWRESTLGGDLLGVVVAGSGDVEGAWRSFVDGLTSRV